MTPLCCVALAVEELNAADGVVGRKVVIGCCR